MNCNQINESAVSRIKLIQEVSLCNNLYCKHWHYHFEAEMMDF